MDNISKKFGFVVLHYLTVEMTKISVNQVLNYYQNDDIHVVIVDNGSPNKSGIALQNYYKDNSLVDVILSKENLGFARGNNIGYRYLKKIGYCDFIVVMNNDILVKHPNDLKTVSCIYEETKFAVLGPDIFCLYNGTHQNPMRDHLYTESEMNALISIYTLKEKFPFISFLHEKIKKCREKHNDFTVQDTYNEQTGTVLHGAFYIFSRKFVDERVDAFCPDTFLYGEEDLLCMDCMNNNFKMVYSPQVSVIHLEHFSTNQSGKSEFMRFKKRNRFMLQAYKIMKNHYINDKNVKDSEQNT